MNFFKKRKHDCVRDGCELIPDFPKTMSVGPEFKEEEWEHKKCKHCKTMFL